MRHIIAKTRVEATGLSHPGPSVVLWRRARKLLAPVSSRHFLHFCSVGMSGVAVNMGFLWLFSDQMGLNANIASALAIELSVVSNFVLNELWTFRGHQAEGTVLGRGVKFHVVATMGAGMQWGVFVLANAAWVLGGLGADGGAVYFGGEADALTRYVLRPIVAPPDVGALKYVSQLGGIAAGVLWNFLGNFHWTWRAQPNAMELNP